MAQPKWLNKYLTMKPEVNKIFEDLDHYREFCVAYGYVFDEKDLYNERSVPFGEYSRLQRGKWARDQWRDGARPERKPREWTPRKDYTRGGHRNNA